MQYLITFLEGVISFLSPCMLPLLPLYLSYFAGGTGEKRRTLPRALAFVLGFTIVFSALGLFAGTLGAFQKEYQTAVNNLFSAFLFGVIYSVSLTPCVGAFLGSALMLASTSGGAAKGALLLLVYSLGLGLPFLLSAVLLEKLNTAFQFIKKHGRVVNLLCGGFLILIGIAMAFGWLNALLAVFS